MARTRAHDYDAKREDMLATAAGLFARHGYRGFSISMIAEACGVSKPLRYHNYPDKETALFDALEKHHLRFVEIVEAAAGERGKR
jgi:AcrR family transcriptional regulator